MAFSFTKHRRGCIGVALLDEGMTIGQCLWSRGRFMNPRVKRLDIKPVELSTDDWRTCMTELGLTGSDCAISIPPSMTYHQVLRLPEMNESELQRAAAWELSDRLGIDRSVLQIDALRLGTSGDVLTVAIKTEEMEKILDPMYSAGLCPTLVEPQSVSAARLFSMLHKRQGDRDKVRSVLDFGVTDTSFMVLAGDEIVFYKYLEYSGEALIEAIEANTGVTSEQARKMLEQSKGQQGDSTIAKAVHNATRATHESIATDAMKCNRHYGVTSRGPISDRIIITGSAGWNEHLGSVLSKACNQDVVPDTHEKHVASIPQEVVSTPGWHVTLGVSLSKVNSSKRLRATDQAHSEAA